MQSDVETAEGFAGYHSTIAGSRYSEEQFRTYFEPLEPEEFRGRSVAELGFGHGSWMWHWARVGPARLSGCDLAETVDAVREKLADVPGLHLERSDLTTADLGPHDLAYCIGVIHHLQEPERGFAALLRHTRPGGRFHGWVYAREGNGLVRFVVEPIRRLAARLPWGATRWLLAPLISVPLFLYSRLARVLAGGATTPRGAARALPLADYVLSHSRRDFGFFQFLATDFLVARHTVFLDRATLQGWLRRPEVDPASVYLVHHRGNAWIFGGRRREAESPSSGAEA